MKTRQWCVVMLVVMSGLCFGFVGGDGSAGNPYQIGSQAHLMNVNNDLSASYILLNDITLAGTFNTALIAPDADNATEEFIGTAFTGTFDGNGKVISNLNIVGGIHHVGLFGMVADGGSVLNLSVAGSVVSSGNIAGGLVGAIVGGTVSGCSANVAVNGDGRAGGLVGRLSGNGAIIDSHATGTVTGDYRVGGLVGQALSEMITNSYATGDVTGNDRVGGLSGEAFGTVFSDCYAEGKITGDSQIGGLLGYISNESRVTHCAAYGQVVCTSNYGGGLVGRALGGSVIVDCFAEGDVDGAERAGGLVGGYQDAVVRNSHATGAVTGTVRVGGLVGQATTNSSTIGSHATGKVKGVTQVGGLAGQSWIAMIRSSYATGDVEGSVGGERIGGLVGEIGGDGNVGAIYCRAYGNVTGHDQVGGFAGRIAGDSAVISQSYAVGSVTSTGSTVGGFAGRNSNPITNCFATGDFDGDLGAWDHGGFVGHNTSAGVIANSYTTSTYLNGASYGGFAGHSDGTILNSFWDVDVDGLHSSPDQNNYGATGKTTAAMQDIQTFLDAEWDIGDAVDGTFYTWILPDFVVDEYPYIYALSPWYVPPFDDGDGTVGNPYQIRTQAQLEAVNRELYSHYIVVDDIELTGTYSAAPIAPDTDNGTVNFVRLAFSGSFNGNGKIISNLTVDGVHNVGLFGSVGGTGQVFGVVLENVNVKGVDNVGGLVGEISGGTVSDCSVSGKVQSTGNGAGGLAGVNISGGLVMNCSADVEVDGIERVGGLVGRNITDTLISGSSAAGDVIGAVRVGGLVGQNTTRSIISNSTASGKAIIENRASLTNRYVGGLVGQNYNGEVHGSTAYGDVTGANRDIGGFVGENSGTSTSVGGIITNSGAYGTVTGNNYTGGFAGSSRNELSVISGCYARGDVVTSGNYVGGLVGDSADGTISNSSAFGDVGGNERIGGLVGHNSGSASLSYCSAVGTVTSTGRYAAGLVGFNNGSDAGIYYSYSVSSVTGGHQSVGGLVGRNVGVVLDCYAHGDVQGGNERVGGLVGDNASAGVVVNSFSTGQVTGVDTYRVGGLIGANFATVENCFWDIETSGTTQSGAGVGKTTQQMKSVRTFTDIAWSDGLDEAWDFVGNPYDDAGLEDIWFIREGISYPRLSWQSFTEADIDLSGTVDIDDFYLLVADWLEEGDGLYADFNYDDVVDLRDFAILASQWLMSWYEGTDVFAVTPGDVPNEGILFVDHESVERSGHGGQAITEALNGDIIAFYSNVCGEANNGHGTSGWSEYKISQDGGQTWSAPYILPYSKAVWDGSESHAALVDEVMTAPNGTIVAIVRRYTDVNRPWYSTTPVVVRSYDNGLTWSQPLEVDPSAQEGQLSREEGSLVYNGTMYVLFADMGDDQPIRRHRLYVSTDNGETFSQRSELPFVYSQWYGTIGVLDNGNLIVYSYNTADDGERLQYTISDDDGHTWSDVKESSFAKRIRNPQLSRKIGEYYFMHGRSGSDGPNPRHLVLYSSNDAINWCEGIYLNVGDTGDLDSYSTNSLVGQFDPSAPTRLLIQSSIAYDDSGRKVNLRHWWVDVSRVKAQ